MPKIDFENIDEMVGLLNKLNTAYRAGSPIVPDEHYDFLVEKLRSIDPDNPYLHKPEPEPEIGRKKVSHTTPMLSMEKAYTGKGIQMFVDRATAAAEKLGFAKDSICFKIGPKLDGLAAKLHCGVLSTRGNGDEGYDITDAVKNKGLIMLKSPLHEASDKTEVYGEIVMDADYFKNYMSSEFSHPRNVCVGAIMSDTLNETTARAMRDKAIRFVSYKSEVLKNIHTTREDLLKNYEEISAKIRYNCQFPTDGIVIEAYIVTQEKDKLFKKELGSSSHHNRWQIAFKTKGETATTTVREVTWQTGRTGVITPVLELNSVVVSGATIRRVTAHNAELFIDSGLGAGAEIEIIRSGEVIPKIERVIRQSPEPMPEFCPCCGGETKYDKPYLYCLNDNCSAKTNNMISHWFKVVGGIDLFGPRTIEKIVNAGFTTIKEITMLGVMDFISVGFSELQAENLFNEIENRRSKPIADWIILASTGINGFGRGDSKRLLQHYTLDSVFAATEGEISLINGFGTKTAKNIADNLPDVKPLVDYMRVFFTNITETKSSTEKSKSGKLMGKRFVFTGTLSSPRAAMEKMVSDNGGFCQSSVTRSTSYLVAGEKAGSKLDKAKSLGVDVLTEKMFLDMLK